ncbi:PREDICTED: putative protein arginine N-methyltransferase 9 [Priapulus caudatus]|uniref:Protein arginine N-methyltransferase domain-containing protein n=1 Tax=Priapulus caudatus TaxID=37621 RepID=A0ABM1E577_PRICU|nr:PREDICTED: putative protein arginine N-methyltransferase 9 [Priapulus caudatus]
MNNWRKVVSKSRVSAHHYIEKGNYGRGFAHYLVVLQLSPDSQKHEVKDEFVWCLQTWTNQLAQAERYDDMFKAFEQAVEIYPECEDVYYTMALQLYHLGFFGEAALHLQKAIYINRHHVAAKETLQNLCSHLVERWHFRMLNDQWRNTAFKNAIVTAVAQGHTSVLDIGAGTALLSMFAVQAGARTVYACEMSPTMHAIAAKALQANSMSDAVMLKCEKSTCMLVPEDIAERVSLVVTETVDSGLLGEGILTTLEHAWDKLLMPAGRGRVIPQGAVLFICLIECDEIKIKTRYWGSSFGTLDLSCARLCSEELRSGRYTSERLAAMRGGYSRLSKPTRCIDVDFNNPQVIKNWIAGVRKTVRVPVVRSGRLDAIAMWFDLVVDTENVVHTSPDRETCWEQAVFPLDCTSMLDAGDTCLVEVRTSADSASFTCTNLSSQLSVSTAMWAEEDAQRPLRESSVEHDTASGATRSGGDVIDGSDIVEGGDLYVTSAAVSDRRCGPSTNGFGCGESDASCLDGSLVDSSSAFDDAAVARTDRGERTSSENSSACGIDKHDLCAKANGLQLDNLATDAAAASRGTFSFSRSTSANCAARLGEAPDGTMRRVEDDASYGTCGDRSLAARPGDGRSLTFPAGFDDDRSLFSPAESRYSQALISTASPRESRSLTSLRKSSESRVLASPGNSNGNQSITCPRNPSDCRLLTSSANSDKDRSQTSQRNPSYNRSLTSPVNCDENRSPMPSATSGDERLPSALAMYGNDRSPSPTATCREDLSPTRADLDEDRSPSPTGNRDDCAPYLPGNPGEDRSPPREHRRATWTHYVGENVVSRLNDARASHEYLRAVTRLCAGRASATVAVIDLSGHFSLLGLHAAKLGAAVAYVGQTARDAAALRAVARSNGIAAARVRFVDRLEECGGGWDAVLVDPVEASGVLQQRVLENVAFARACSLKPAGTVLPHSLSVYGILIDSLSLQKDCKVLDDECTLGLKVAPYINQYQTYTQTRLNTR